MDVGDIVQLVGLQDVVSESAVKLGTVISGLIVVVWAMRLLEKSDKWAALALAGEAPHSGTVPQSYLGDYDVWSAGNGKGVFYQKAGWLEPKHARSFEDLRYKLGYSPKPPSRSSRGNGRRRNRRRARRMNF